MATISIPESEFFKDPPLAPAPAVQRLVIEARDSARMPIWDYAREIVRFSDTSSERDRRAFTRRRRDILRDNWSRILWEDLKNRLTGPVQRRVCGKNGEFVDISRNIARDIWREEAVLYQTKALRSTEDPIQAEKYNQLLRGSKFNTFWQCVELYFEAFNDLVIWPSVISSGGKLKIVHNWAAGDSVSVFYDEHTPPGGDPAGIVLIEDWRDLNDKEHRNYRVWTHGTRFLFNENLERLDPETGVVVADDMPGFFSPIGDELPHVLIQRDPHSPDNWDRTTGEDLVQLTLKVGRWQTYTNYLWKMAGHKQMVVSGDKLTKAAPQLLDPSVVARFEGTAITTQLWDLQANFKERQSVMDAEEVRAAATRGINAERLRKTSYQTSEGAQLSERGLVESRRRKQEIFQDAEAEYYRKVSLVARSAGFANVPDPDALLEVTHAPIEYPTSPLEQLEVTKQKISMGMASLVDSVLREHPDWTPERAIEFITDNVELNARIADIRASRNIPDDPTVESRTAEENGRLGPMMRDQDTGSQPDTTVDT